MLTYRTDVWTPIQQRLVEAGYSNIPNGQFVDSYYRNGYTFFIIEFDSESDEIIFLLQWA